MFNPIKTDAFRRAFTGHPTVNSTNVSPYRPVTQEAQKVNVALTTVPPVSAAVNKPYVTSGTDANGNKVINDPAMNMQPSGPKVPEYNLSPGTNTSNTGTDTNTYPNYTALANDPSLRGENARRIGEYYNGATGDVPNYTPSLSTVNNGQTLENTVNFNTDPFALFDQSKNTVAGQLETLLRTDNPLARQAEARALEGANTKGLASSTMAVGAAEGARDRAMMEVAKEDADTYNKYGLKNLAGEQSKEQIGLRGQEERTTLSQSGNQDLATIAATGNQALIRDAYSNNFKAEQDKYNWGNKFKELNISNEFNESTNNINNALAYTLSNADLTSSEKRSLGSTFNTLYTNGLASINSVFNNTDLSSDKQKEAIKDIVARMESGATTLGSIFDYNVTIG